ARQGGRGAGAGALRYGADAGAGPGGGAGRLRRAAGRAAGEGASDRARQCGGCVSRAVCRGACADRRRGLGESGADGGGIRASRSDLGFRPGGRAGADRDRAGGGGAVPRAARGRKAGALLRSASGELGAAGGRGGEAWAALRRTLPDAEQPGGGWVHPRLARGDHGAADRGGCRGAGPDDGGARRGAACRHADRPALRAGAGGALPRAAGGVQPAARAAGAALRLPGAWGKGDPAAPRAVPAGADRGGGAAAGRARAGRCGGGDGAGQPDRRGLGAGASGAVALDAPAVAL
ncbi:MAG: Lipid A biosynthesis lauroyl acyltransferase, partial [uncultured Craurococcus sp.]